MTSNITIVKSGSTVDLCAILNYCLLPNRQVTWKKVVYTPEEIKNRSHIALENNGETIEVQTLSPLASQSCQYTFKKKDEGKYIKFYAYIYEFISIAQTAMVYVEPPCETDILVDSVNPREIDALVGDTIKCSVVYHKNQQQETIPEDKVPQTTKDNVKWAVKIDAKTEQLIVDDEVMRGGNISLKIPTEWDGKEVLLMPYLKGPSEKVSANVKVGENKCFCKKQGLVLNSCNGKGCNIDDKVYEDAATALGVEVAALKAIGKKETHGNSFYSTGQATILFERHYMYCELKKKGYTEKQLSDLNTTYPSIVNSTMGEYGTYSAQYTKLTTAKNIDYDCAIKSCSWGKFQVMGVYYANLYSTPRTWKMQ